MFEAKIKDVIRTVLKEARNEVLAKENQQASYVLREALDKIWPSASTLNRRLQRREEVLDRGGLFEKRRLFNCTFLHTLIYWYYDNLTT